MKQQSQLVFLYFAVLMALIVYPAYAKDLFVSDICKEALGFEKKMM